MKKRHLFFSLLLVLLLAGDILTTVWFTSLGLPEANPLIAPIAGSVLDQIVYKAPFAAVLLAGTWLASRRCDRYAPGSGVCVWVLVLLLYAVPVAHNCVAILSC